MPWNKTKKFNGKTYLLSSNHGTKTNAKLHAQRMREIGRKSRIIKNKSEWLVYTNYDKKWRMK